MLKLIKKELFNITVSNRLDKLKGLLIQWACLFYDADIRIINHLIYVNYSLIALVLVM